MEAIRSIPDDVPADNRTLGWQALEWCADYLQQPDGPNAGDPWEFTPEQVRIVLRWYGIDQAGRFIYRRGVLRRMKGWGKDPFLAAISAVELCGPCRFDGWDARGNPVAVRHPAPWIQVAAVAREQTRNTMTVYPGLFTPDAIDTYAIDLGKEIIYSGRHGRIEAVTSSPRALEGGRPSLVIANETHHWLANNSGIEMAHAIRRNLGKSRDGSARVMEITNAHCPGEESAAEATYEAWTKGRGQGIYYDALEAPPVELDDTPALADALRAARGDSVWLDVDRIVAEIADPTTPESIARRYYLNQVVEAEEAWLPAGAWSACEHLGGIAPGRRVTLGFDGAIREDSTALVACDLETGHLALLALWEKPAGPLGNSWQVPRPQVDAAVHEAFQTYDVVRLYADPPHWQDYLDTWATEWGDVVTEFWTMSLARMSKALERLHTAVVTGEVTHSGDAKLASHVGNAVAVPARGGSVVNKRRPSDKIDALVAAVLAYEARAEAIENGALSVVDLASNVW